jgi:hypothetical protein
MSQTGPQEEIQHTIHIPEDLQLVAVMMNEIRRALMQSSNFKNFKRGQIVLKFKDHGRYDGMGIIIQD